MAKSFWSRRNEATTIGSDDVVPQNSSGFRGILTTVFGILIVGGLLFGVFWGARWTFNKFTEDSTSIPVVTAPSEDTKDETNTAVVTDDNTHDASLTVTPSTNTPSQPSPTIPPTTSIPDTGPGSSLTIFLAVSLFAYLAHRLVLSRR